MATVKIKSGDTLSQLAKDNKTTVAAIVAANPSITNANKIQAGASLTIPTPSTTVVPVKTQTITPTVTKPVSTTGTTTKPAVSPATSTTVDPDRELARQIRDNQISGSAADTAVQNLGATSNNTSSSSSSSSSSAAPTVDATLQGYKDQYAAAQSTGNKVGMLMAAEAADNYRVSQGQAATNAAQIARLKSELTTQDYLDYSTGALADKNAQLTNFDQTYVPKVTEEDYMSKISAYVNSILQEQKNIAEANAKKARAGILSDADITKQELDDSYAAQLAELSSQADEIRNAYSTGKRNVDTQNTDTMDSIAAQADKIIQLYEQSKNELGANKQSLSDELSTNVDKIKNAYSTAKTGIESTKAETLPTYDTAMNQQDILAQRQAKQLEGEFAQRGLSAGGQVTSELGQAGQTNLSEIGKITGQKQSYERDVSNKLTGLEQEQATGLADAERKKIQIEQDYTNSISEIESNKTLSLADAERLKGQAERDYQNSLADLEQGRVSGLAGIARAEGAAAQTLSSGKMAIIKKVNDALNNLTTDEQTSLDNLAEKRSQMLYEASQKYSDLSKAEKDTAFNQLLQEAGVAADSVDTMRTLIDDVNKAKTSALEYQIKELEYENMSKSQKLELDKLKNDIKLGNISAAQAAAQIKLQQDKFAFDKEQQLTETERTQYNNYIDMVDSSSFISKDAGGITQISDKAGLRSYIIGLNLDDTITDPLLLRYGLPIN